VARRGHSTITRLPQELRSQLDRLLTQGKFTLVEITDHMRQLGADVSKSAVHRYSQHHEKIASDIRLTREMANAIGRELEDVTGDSGRLVIESMQAILLRARMQIASGEEIDPKQLGELARAAKDLQHALKLNVDTEIKIRERVVKEAADVVEKAATAEGLSAATVTAIKEKVLGIGRS